MEEVEENEAHKIETLHDEQQPSTSHGASRSKSPRNSSHKASDLQIFEYNSADDVRQTLKSALATPNAQKNEQDKKTQNKKRTSRGPNGAKIEMWQLSSMRATASKVPIVQGLKRLTNRGGQRRLPQGLQMELQQEVKQEDQREGQREQPREEQREAQPGVPLPKRRGRPPKTASSKRRRMSITELYNGKLSNLIHLSRRSRDYSDSDIDSRA